METKTKTLDDLEGLTRKKRKENQPIIHYNIKILANTFYKKLKDHDYGYKQILGIILYGKLFGLFGGVWLRLRDFLGKTYEL